MQALIKLQTCTSAPPLDRVVYISDPNFRTSTSTTGDCHNRRGMCCTLLLCTLLQTLTSVPAPVMALKHSQMLSPDTVFPPQTSILASAPVMAIRIKNKVLSSVFPLEMFISTPAPVMASRSQCILCCLQVFPPQTSTYTPTLMEPFWTRVIFNYQALFLPHTFTLAPAMVEAFEIQRVISSFQALCSCLTHSLLHQDQ